MQCYNCNSKKLKYKVENDAYYCLDCGYEYKKQYFFISHSHLDIEKVRIIRNIIEETFFYEPILFFLKCLSDENEITSLVKREIEERIWFVYCKSENAEKSKYVKQEREHIANLIKNGKKINVLNVELDKFEIWDENCHNYIQKQIEYQIKKTKLFASYSNIDRANVLPIIDYFIVNNIRVWHTNDIVVGDFWATSVKSKIKEHSYKDGAFLLFISNNSLNSNYVYSEIENAIENNSFIIPVIMANTKEEYDMLAKSIYQKVPALKDVNFIWFNLLNQKESLKNLLDSIKSY